MNEVLFSTGNAEKFGTAVLIAQKYGITLVQDTFDIDEIQGEDPARIITDKATKAYAITGRPTIVSDDSWDIPALNGFPGPYMKSVNGWFSTDDFLNLMRDKTDRRIFLHSYLAYVDGAQIKLFKRTRPATILQEARGDYGTAMAKVVSMDSDKGRSLSEIQDTANGSQDRDEVFAAWHGFGRWYSQQ